MAQEIKIPKLGLTMTDATLVSWLIRAGEHVVEGQIICIIETDKVSFEMPAPGAGLLHPVVEAGRRVTVSELIGYVAIDQAELNEMQARQAAVETEPMKHTAAAAAQQVSSNELLAGDPSKTPSPKPAAGERILVSPAARKLSKKLGIRVEEIFGSGPEGRIILADVEKAADTIQKKRTEAMYNFESAVYETEVLCAAEQIPIHGIRKIISKNMKLSLASQAQLTLHTEASAKDLGDLRCILNGRLEADQPRISYNAIIVKASAQALRRFPMLNAAVDGHEIKIWRQIHIGIAMDFGQGLIVPKIRNADTKSIRTISEELKDITVRAEKKKLLPDELQAGTFTITNLGSWDIDYFTPISNFPESAILGIGRIIDKPWVRNGAVVAEPRIALSLTFDHRIIDGALAAKFLKSLKDRLEETRLML